MNSLAELLHRAQARFDAMTPVQQANERQLQRESFLRSIANWPKPNYKWVNGVKVYATYEDYCND